MHQAVRFPLHEYWAQQLASADTLRYHHSRFEPAFLWAEGQPTADYPHKAQAHCLSYAQLVFGQWYIHAYYDLRYICSLKW